MSNKNIIGDLKPIENAEQWQQMMDDSTNKLVVIDVSEKWCGPCEVLRPLWNGIALDYDDWASILSFRSVNNGVLDPVTEMMDQGDDQAGCQPAFLFVRNRKLVQKVQGCNAPLIRSVITDTINSTGLGPKEEEEEE
jgi:thiol-disulfide isomerase/thioredoxin